MLTHLWQFMSTYKDRDQDYFLRRVDLAIDYCAGKSLRKFLSYKSLIQFSDCTTILEIPLLLCPRQEAVSGCF